MTCVATPHFPIAAYRNVLITVCHHPHPQISACRTEELGLPEQELSTIIEQLGMRGLRGERSILKLVPKLGAKYHSDHTDSQVIPGC